MHSLQEAKKKQKQKQKTKQCVNRINKPDITRSYPHFYICRQSQNDQRIKIGEILTSLFFTLDVA